MVLTPKQQARTKWKMKNVVTFDIEAKDWTEPVAVGMVEPDGTYTSFTGATCIKDFVQEMMRAKHRNHRFVAHNGGGYDFGFIIAELIKQDYNFQILTKGNGDMFYVDVRDSNDKPRHLQDSLALMPRSLESLTDSFCPDMPKLDFDVETIDFRQGMDDDEWFAMLEYLERDCRALRRVLSAFTDTITQLSDGECSCQLTIGSTTMAMYRTAFMDDEAVTKIQGCHKPDATVDPEQCFRASYFGGRTEVFRINGDTDDYDDVDELYHYDVNSLYPTAYATTQMPVGNVVHVGGSQDVLDRDKYGGVAYITGHVPENTDLPVLPVRISPDDSNEKVVFPTGDIEGWYMLREIRYAMDVDALENVHVDDAYISRYGEPFKQYGTTLYDMKQTIDSDRHPGKYKVVKLLLNSFYGKFGMDRQQGQIERLCPDELRTEPYKPIGNGNMESLGIVQMPDTADSDYILPRIASAITAEARIIMHRWFMRVHEQNGRIWYCDTDSVVTDVELPEGDELGEMDLEGVIDEAYFLRPKTYAEQYTDDWHEDSLIKAKGMRNVNDYVDFEDFRGAFRNGELAAIRSEWVAPKGLKAGMKAQPRQIMIKDSFKRSLKGMDDKRDHSDDGKRSQPLNVNVEQG